MRCESSTYPWIGLSSRPRVFTRLSPARHMTLVRVDMEQDKSMKRDRLTLPIILGACVMLTGRPVSANEHTSIPPDLLQRASGSIRTLVQQVSPSVVQISVTGYRPVTGSNGDMALARARTIGSGVIVDSGGYILTNAHVVQGADRIDVILAGDGQTDRSTMRTVKATLVGVTDELDLALLLVPIKGLRAVH